MIKLLEILFYNYYKLQLYLGETKDSAAIRSVMMITFFFGILIPSILFILFIVILKENINENIYHPIYSLILIFIINWYLFLYKGRYKNIIKSFDNGRKKRKWLAILFPILSFLLFNIGWIIKMLQNQGRW